MDYRTLAESIVSIKRPNEEVKYATEKVIADTFAKYQNQQIIGEEEKIEKKIDLIRSESDKFDYKLIQLHNGVRIMLVSDPTFDQLDTTEEDSDSDLSDLSSLSDDETTYQDGMMSDQEEEDDDDDDDDSMSTPTDAQNNKKGKTSAIVVAANAGSFQDPAEFPGLAHMLEHMMSMGSEMFPSENAIDRFLCSRGGAQNAFTQCEYTCFEVEVHREHLKKTINLIGQAFIAPLLRQKSIEREINPVDTEFAEACTSDESRITTLLSHLANKKHPISKFAWGNRKSLITDPTAKGLDIRKALINFFTTYYHPENLLVVVQSQHSLQCLEKWTEDVFSQVKVRRGNQCKSSLSLSPSLLPLPLPYEDNTNFTQLYLVEGIGSESKLLVNWSFPSVLPYYLHAPLYYLGSVIGYHGKGSLISELRKRDLALELTIELDDGCSSNNRLCSLFQIEIDLTDRGIADLDQVVWLLFEYLAVIRNTGAQEYYFREIQSIALRAFNTKSEQDALTYSLNLAINLLHFPIEHALVGSDLYCNFNKPLLDQFFDKLQVENANFIYLGCEFKPDLQIKQEPWMGTNYQVMPVPDSWKEQKNQCNGMSHCFHYPLPNPFIATNFDLLRDTLPLDEIERQQLEYPSKIYHTPRLSMWHKADFEFNLPRATCNILLMSPCMLENLQNTVMLDVLNEYLNILYMEVAYDAIMADMSFDLNICVRGLHLEIEGYNQKVPDLMILLLKHISTLKFNSIFLETIKRKVLKNYVNVYKDSETLTYHLQRSLLHREFQTLFQRRDVLSSITKEKMEQYLLNILSNLSIDVLVQGNVAVNESILWTKQIETNFSLCTNQTGEPYRKIKDRVWQLPYGRHVVRMLGITQNSGISNITCYYQVQPYELKYHVYLSVFVNVINELCFNTLRTQQGLGYNVGCMEYNIEGILGYNVYVSSMAEKFDCSHVLGRIEEFINTTCAKFVSEELDEKKFAEFISAAIRSREEPDLNLKNQVSRNMTEIKHFEYCFDRLKQQVAVLKGITLADFKSWACSFIFVPSQEQKLLCFEIVGNGKKSLQECLFADGKQVTQEHIPKFSDENCLKLQLVLPKNPIDAKAYILNVDEFKSQLQLYEVQTTVDCMKS